MAEMSALTRANTIALLPVSIDILPAAAERRDKKTDTNVVKTAKYNLITFLPFSLYELLHPSRRFANFFYLCVGILQCVPFFSPTGRAAPLAWTSLAVILIVDLIIIAKDDLAKHRADTKTNAQAVNIISVNEQGVPSERTATWADVRAGDGAAANASHPERSHSFARCRHAPEQDARPLCCSLPRPPLSRGSRVARACCWQSCASRRRRRSLQTCCCCVARILPASAGSTRSRSTASPT